MNLTDDGTTYLQCSRGGEISFALSGTFDGATVEIQHATAGPVAAYCDIDDDTETGAIHIEALYPGASENSITFAIEQPDAPATLSVSRDGWDYTITPETDDGDAATAVTATVLNATITVTHGTAGTAGNAWKLRVVNGSGADVDLSAIISGAYDAPTILVTLGTAENGAPDDTKNTGTLVAAAIDALEGFSAATSGNGSGIVAAENDPIAFSGGGENPTITSTSAEVVAFLNSQEDFNQWLVASLLDEYDGAGLVVETSETSLANGTEGTFASIPGTFPGADTLSFTAAGGTRIKNVGATNKLAVVVSDAGESTSITLLAHT